MARRIVVLASAVMGMAAFMGCSIATDNGRLCDLVKSDGDGGSTFITESEVTPGKDFVSFGVAECENFVCVRAATQPKTGDPAARATGKCSTRCASPDSRCDSAVSDVKLSCRALILDEVTLGQICLNDAQKCERYFGGAQTPYFCAEAGVVRADGGI